MSRSPLTLFPLFLVFSPAVAHGQEHYTLGPINRVILVDIKPGKTSEFWTDMRQSLRPLWDEFKRQGLIQGYSVGVKTTTERPDDWDAVIILTFKNWAAMDVFASKGDSVSMRYYGSYGKRSEAGAKRTDSGTVVGSYLVRDVTLREMSR